MNPELMGFHMSAHAIMMVILGGMGNFAGAVVGAFAFEFLMHTFKDMTKHWQLLMGSFIVLTVIVAPKGLLGIGQALHDKWLSYGKKQVNTAPPTEAGVHHD
jgi:branched-chain amino acid transport system permease protein